MSAVIVSFVGAIAMRLAAAITRVRARLVLGVGPRLGDRTREPKIDVRLGLPWCWTRVEEHGGRALAVRASGPVAMVLVPFTAVVIAVMVVGVPRVDVGPPLLVGHVLPGSPASAAGIEAGDRIVAIDGVATPDVDALRSELGARFDPRELTVERRGRRISLRIVPVGREGRASIGIVPPVVREHPGVADAASISVRAVVATWSAVLGSLLGRIEGEVASPIATVQSAAQAQSDASFATLVVTLLVAYSAIALLWASIAAVAQIAAAIVAARRASRAPS